MKALLLLTTVIIIGVISYLIYQPESLNAYSNYTVYHHVEQCKEELGITRKLPVLSCLDGKQIPIYVDKQEIKENNWEKLLSLNKRCDNPHWLGGDMGCWTYSHFQIKQLDDENIMVLNCRQKGNQFEKDWFRKTITNLGMNQQQRKDRYESASDAEKKELYYLYNTFNDIGIILRNTKTGKSCYLTQYGEAVVGFLPPLDQPLPSKEAYLTLYNSEQARPPKDFPLSLWYRDANQAFKTPAFTAEAGCVACHNAHGFKYSPYINSKHGLPDIYSMAPLPFLAVGEPFQNFFNNHHIVQVTTDPIDGEQQLCTRCHKMTTSGTCGYSLEFATGHPDKTLNTWLTSLPNEKNWMPPITADPALVKKHVAAMKCCCDSPQSEGCKSRKFGPTLADLPEGFHEGKGWTSGQQPGLCKDIMESYQWNADKY